MTEAFGSSFFIDDRPRTREYEEALRLHKVAARNLEHIFQHVRGIVKPSMTDIYLEHAHAACAPHYLDFHVLFKNFNNIAGANFVARPDLDSVTNGVIFYYGMDKLHSFNKYLDQSRLNLCLAVFSWGRKLIGHAEEAHNASYDLWYKYIVAWIESMIPGGGFDNRHAFLEEWSTSDFDLAWFSRKQKDKMMNLLATLAAGKPPMDGDAATFIDKCARKEISADEFMRVGPAMATHFLLAMEAKKKEEEDQVEHLKRLETQEHAARLQQVRANMPAYVPSGEVGDDEDFDAPLPSFEEDEDDEMAIDDPYPVPEGVHLSGVNWDAGWMQALLNIDLSLQRVDGRPVTNRIPWIDQDLSYRTLYTRGDELADELSKLLCL